MATTSATKPTGSEYSATNCTAPSDDGATDKTEWTESSSTISKPDSATTGQRVSWIFIYLGSVPFYLKAVNTHSLNTLEIKVKLFFNHQLLFITGFTSWVIP